MFCNGAMETPCYSSRRLETSCAKCRRFCENSRIRNVEFSQWETCFMNEIFHRVTVCNAASIKKERGYAVEKGPAESHIAGR